VTALDSSNYHIVYWLAHFWLAFNSVFHHALVLVLGIGIGIGQYYWVLGIGCLVWYRSNPILYICGDYDSENPLAVQHWHCVTKTQTVTQHSRSFSWTSLFFHHYSCDGHKPWRPQTMTMMASTMTATNRDNQRHNLVKFVQRCQMSLNVVNRLYIRRWNCAVGPVCTTCPCRV